ncbi:leucine-rich repeat-containing protein 9-like isoform X2 [Physella acuta]|uniref:leucine-rich repeat-containing protein 9-like isoform X2 n=1 Tax=Physella acuta TaxID=109671 RepID=UPI0027DE6F78|nr:leucine-rich repeat-containing protein 9-like isoform X2 [Physella acuta]
MNNSSKTSYYNEVSSTETSQLSEVAPRDSDQETPRPQLSFKSNDDEILREVCLNNGINYKKLYLEGPETTVLEMFFSGYPRLIGMHHFPNLTTLTVIGQSVTRLEGLSDLPNLDELWIAECQLTRIEGLDHCTSLTKLYLYGNRISVIENIHHLINIKILWLNNNLIEHIENLHTLTKLRELNIAENLIEKIGNALVYNINLEELNLSGNPLWSLRDLTCLVKLQKLTRLSLKDPLYHPCPASHLCNFSTHVLYHLPKLTCLDTLDITSKQLADLVEGTVNKKKMFYNMRAKTIRRNMSDLLMRLEDTSKELLELPHSKLKVINFVIKEMEREIMMETQITTEENEKESEKYKSSFKAKLQMIKQKKSKWEKKAHNIESYAKLSETRVRQMADMMVKRLLVELETGGNVRFEDGLATDPWFSSCHDLVLSRFCAYDYRDLGVTGIKIHRITRIHNRMLRTRFDKSIVTQTESNKGEYYPGSKNTAYKKSLEYLFWMSDPAMEGGLNESFRIPEEGFMSAETYLKLKRDGAVPLSNSISLADRRRINYCLKTAVDSDQEIDSCPFRYGHLIVAKAHLGKSVIAKDDLLITMEHYPKMDSVFKPRKKCIPNEKKAEEDGCECSSRQCEWYIFNSNLVLPEYIIDFEYITRLKSQCPFQHLNEDLLSEQPQKNSIPVVWQGEDDSDSDSDIIKMEPEIKSRQRVSLLTERVILQAAHATALDKITVLNLHGNGITKLRPLQALSKLDVLIVSFNELTRLDDLSNMQMTVLDASFNKIYTLDGMKGMTKLKELNVSWNKLVNTREELSILRKHLSSLHVLDFRNNPWLKARDLRLRAIGRLRNLEVLDEKKVEDEEAALALRCAAGSRISQLSLLTHSRTDSTVPRSLSLGDSAHVITMISRNRPLKTCETDTKWYSQITTLNLDNQHITKLSNLERLENLLWASFNNNDLTRIEGLDSCTQLQELSLTNNCIAHLEGLSKLSCIQKLDLSHNCLTSIDTGVLANMLSLASLSLESNRLTSLAGLQKCNALTELYIGNNTISNIREVFLLKSLSNLVILDMYGNPMVTAVENYRLFVIYHLRSLKALDGSAIEMQDCTMAKDLFGGRLTPDFIAERLGHSIFSEVRELDLPNCGIRTVDLGSELFVNLRSVNLEHNNLLSFNGLIYLVNLRVLCLNHNHIESLLPKPKQSQQALKKPAISTTSKNADNLPAPGTPVLENLEVLHLGYNGIKDMAALQLNRLPSLKALFLQGNEITKVEGLDGLHDLRELVLDKNKIKQLTEFSFANQWNLQELHMEENRLRDLSGLSCLENLMRLYLGSNRITEQMDLEKLDSMRYLTEISLINNPVSRRMIHRIILIHRLPRLTVIDGITITDEERSRTELHFSDQVLQLAAPPVIGVESGFPGLGLYKPSVQVKVTNMQLNSASMWGNTTFSEEDNGQRARAKRPTRDPSRQPFGLSGGNTSMAQNNNSNSRIQYTYLNQTTYNGQTPEYMESINRLNQQRGNKR